MTSFPFGSLDSYVLSYKELDGQQNKVLVVDNLPLPVMAHYYLPDENLHYIYKIVSLDDPTTPTATCSA